MHKQIDSRFEVKFQADSGQFEGYASVFHVVDSAHDRMAPGAFRRCLAEMKAGQRLPPLLWQHDTAQPIGAWREMYEDGHGLFVKGDLFVGDIARAREAYKLMKEKVVNGLSIGYRVRQSHKDHKSGVRVLTDVDLLEVSMVTFPANDSARILRVKSALATGDVPTEREFEAFLRDAGLSRKQAKALLADGYKSLCADHHGWRDAAQIDHGDTPLEGDCTAEALRGLTARIRALT